MPEEPLPRPPAPPVPATMDETFVIEPASRALAGGQRVLNRYLLESVLGQGGMGVVWRAYDETLRETVALKVLPEAVARDKAAMEELKEETRRARRLTHPNIVRTHDFVESEGFGAVSMECVEGDTLANLRLTQPGKIYSVVALAPLVAQLCAALDYAHRTAKVVHRDLKPANLLVTRDGQLKVADFGISRGLAEASVRLTGKVGETSGTLLYASPQQLFGEKPTESDDIYALGTTLYELLTGKPPFYRGDAHILMMQVREKVPLSLAKQREELETTGEPIPRVWEKTILACLAKRPEDRPASARDVGVELGLAREPAAGGTTGQHQAAAGTSVRGGWRWLAVGGAVAAIGAGLGYFLWPSKPAAPVNASGSSTTINSDAVVPAPAGEFVVTIDPPDVDARISVGANLDMPAKNGRLALTNLPDGEHDLLVKAVGYQNFGTRVVVKNNRGSTEVRLLAVRGTLELKARPGTVVTAVDSRGKETRGTVDAAGQLLLENLSVAGRYTLRVEHEDCAQVERTGVEILADTRTKVAVEQATSPGELRVFSVPAEAEVRVNGKVVGRTPATLKNQLSEQPLTVEVVAKGYRKAERTLTLRPKEVRSVNVGTLVPTTSGIDIRNLPKGVSMGSVRVLIDGREMKPKLSGEAWRVDGLESGARVVEILHPDYQPWKQTVNVEDRETAELEVKLGAKPATLALHVSGPAVYKLLVNGTEVPVMNGKAALVAGNALALQVRAPGFLTATHSVTMKPNAVENWDVTLEKSVPPQAGQSWTNRLGLKFVPVPGVKVLFSTWDTRVQDYQAFVTATRRTWPKPDFEQGPTHPAVMVSWDDANAFCDWLTKQEQSEGRFGPTQRYRLPSDAEWSAAAGMPSEGNGTPEEKHIRLKGYYSWGSSYPPPKGAGNFSGEESGLEVKVDGYVDPFPRTSPVGSFAPNRFGLYDMGGNVLQWCEDLFSPSNTMRVRRGTSFGSWGSNGLLLSLRDKAATSARPASSGFRCVIDPEVASAPTQVSAVPAGPQSPASAIAKSVSDGQIGENSIGMKFVAVPGVSGLFGVWDVRVQDYEKFASATRRKWSKPSFAQGPTHPAVNVSWDDATAFCAWLTTQEQAAGRLGPNQKYRLPTDAEWSVAVGLNEPPGGTPHSKDGQIKGVYPWGTQFPPPSGAGNYGSSLKVDAFENTSPVGSFTANKFGLYDMGGNVWQWCEDFSDGRSGARVLRGAAFIGGRAVSLLSSYRGFGFPGRRYDYVGFRVVAAVGGASSP